MPRHSVDGAFLCPIVYDTNLKIYPIPFTLHHPVPGHRAEISEAIMMLSFKTCLTGSFLPIRPLSSGNILGPSKPGTITCHAILLFMAASWSNWKHLSIFLKPWDCQYRLLEYPPLFFFDTVSSRIHKFTDLFCCRQVSGSSFNSFTRNPTILSKRFWTCWFLWFPGRYRANGS